MPLEGEHAGPHSRGRHERHGLSGLTAGARAASGDTFALNSPSHTDPTTTNLTFQLGSIGAEIGQLAVVFDDGVNPPVLLNSYTAADPAQSQGGIEWSGVLALPQPLPASDSFQSVYTTLPIATGGFTFQGDLAVDDICLNRSGARRA